MTGTLVQCCWLFSDLCAGHCQWLHPDVLALWSDLVQDSPVHHLRHGLRLHLHPRTHGGRQVAQCSKAKKYLRKNSPGQVYGGRVPRYLPKLPNNHKCQDRHSGDLGDPEPPCDPSLVCSQPPHDRKTWVTIAHNPRLFFILAYFFRQFLLLRQRALQLQCFPHQFLYQFFCLPHPSDIDPLYCDAGKSLGMLNLQIFKVKIFLKFFNSLNEILDWIPNSTRIK